MLQTISREMDSVKCKCLVGVLLLVAACMPPAQALGGEHPRTFLPRSWDINFLHTSFQLNLFPGSFVTLEYSTDSGKRGATCYLRSVWVGTDRMCTG